MRRSYFIGASYVNRNGILTPQSCQRMSIEVLENLFYEWGSDVPKLIRKEKKSWVLLSMTVESERFPRAGEILEIETKGVHLEGRICRCDEEAYLADGSIAFRVALFISVLDLNTRRLCEEKDVERLSGPKGGVKLLQAESRVSGITENLQFYEMRRIHPSWVDELGHVNQLHYGELAYDGLSERVQNQMEHLKKIQIFFLHELSQNVKVRIMKSEEEKKTTVIGYHENGKQAFVYVFHFTA